MCYSILYFTPSTEKNDSLVVLKNLNPEGPLSSYLCGVTLPALSVTCQLLFCGTKKINRIFIYKKSKFLSFLWSIFLVPVFLCSFFIPFTEDSVIFIKSIFNILLFLIIKLHHTFCDSRIYWDNARVQFESFA